MINNIPVCKPINLRPRAYARGYILKPLRGGNSIVSNQQNGQSPAAVYDRRYSSAVATFWCRFAAENGKAWPA